MVIHPVNSGACLEPTHFVFETKTIASPQVSVVSHPVNSGACLEPTFFDSEPNIHLTVEKETVHTAKFQSDLNKLCAEETESEQSDPEIDSPSASGYCLKEGEQSLKCTGCKYVRYCSKNCQVEHLHLHVTSAQSLLTFMRRWWC